MSHFEDRPLGVRKGAWTTEEDDRLKKYIEKHGEDKWHQVPLAAGLNRCRKSCRLRWLNYLRPNIRRGEFSVDEVDYILRLHKLLGNRWSLIAGRLPGRTANDVKNYWNTHLRKKTISGPKKPQDPPITKTIVTRPRPRTFSKTILEMPSLMFNSSFNSSNNNNCDPINKEKGQLCKPSADLVPATEDGDKQWWEDLLNGNNDQHCLASSSVSSWSEEDFPSNLWI